VGKNEQKMVEKKPKWHKNTFKKEGKSAQLEKNNFSVGK
jgi:hypothetical protein